MNIDLERLGELSISQLRSLEWTLDKHRDRDALEEVQAEIEYREDQGNSRRSL